MDVFNKYYQKYDYWYDKNKVAYFSELKAIKQVLPKKGRGLEIGVGTGRFAAGLGIKYGVDIAENMLELAVDRGVKAVLANAVNLPFKDGIFDYIVFIISFCFIKNPEYALKEAKRVLKNKGKIIIAIVDKESFLGKFYQTKKSLFYKHTNFFKVKEIEQMLKAEGFVNFDYLQTLFRLPAELSHLDRVEKGFGQGGFVVITARKNSW